MLIIYRYSGAEAPLFVPVWSLGFWAEARPDNRILTGAKAPGYFGSTSLIVLKDQGMYGYFGNGVTRSEGKKMKKSSRKDAETQKNQSNCEL